MSPVLSGDLTVEFPGRSVKLGGPALHVTLVHARITHGDSAGITTVDLPGQS